MEMRGPRLTLCLLLISKIVAEDVCESGLFSSGKCCSVCLPGFGVAVPCGVSDTKCAPCKENSTFSDVRSATAKCQLCSPCLLPSVKESSCTREQDTICRCPDGQYLDNYGICRPCQLCPKGQGVVSFCSRDKNTECQLCPSGFYSEVKSRESPCLPCRTECKETEVQIGDCMPQHDILCMDKDIPILKPIDGDARGENGTTAGSPHFIPPADNSKNIIPVYCSILAAVVVGLICYVAFKCYTTCKQKKQLAKARAGELATSAEGEKLHSDSGVFLDTHSLQEPNHLSKAKIEPKLYINLPPHKQSEVERLLADTSLGKDWQRLASLLGYEEETIDTLGRGEDPVHTLLTDWSSKESSTLEVLCAALVNMERADVVENLNSANDASSVV
ncbi:neurotrophin receptor associated death domain S homeolog precursor [Xenopus laevis]|uniref:Neurotrophin receptor associated death domain S homeolog precursor n=2 Tax=Xenopus laevis TaxID=8355 RepID=Q68Y16_XENLA|nr:neurotrophin receptor associated death domain S homeolog precursor [Xenopus laevis]BAD36762.1 neurotrophin receptor-related protein 1b [Xenopus laevis]